MEGMEEKLGAILGNPQMMQQIMSMAQALGASQPPPPETPQPPAPPGIDPATIGKLAPLLRGTGIDRQQRDLLKALEPYLSQSRLERLERAMQATKLAALITGFLPGGGSHV